MSAEPWAGVKALFDELVELAPGPRAERLAGIARSDPVLERELERLLAADTDAEALLGRLEPLARLLSLGSVSAEPRTIPPEPCGRMLSHFTLVERLGSGGMGAVYRAEDSLLRREVALKVPHPEYRHDAAWKERFLQEARAAAALDHPNLCVIHEVGEDAEGRPFLAMPLYRGETLKARLAHEGPLPPADALTIAAQVAAGLSAVHAAGIIHRDLKPANVMLLPHRGVKILDFGLAKVRDLSITGAGARLGTVAYMAPEQVRGDPLDHRADLWALGVMLYEMMTGRRPFTGEHDISLAHAIVHREPEPPSALRADLAPAVDRLVLALLEKDPGGRPSDAELQAALAELAAGVPLRIGRRHSRYRAAALGVAVSAVAAVAFARGMRPRPATPGDPDLVAVAPFDVLDPSLQLWREGLVDILSRDLDGAGQIRTVSQTVALKRWSGRADPASAARLGERTGAGLVVFGSMVRKAADSVSLRAAVLDRSRGGTTADFELVGDELRIGALADSLGLAILRALGRERPIGSVRHVSLGSRSLPALREFLRAEQFYRRGMWDSALAHYDRSAAQDSSFGLPLFRMSRVLGWGPRTSRTYREPGEYEGRAVRLTQGLAPRDSLILAFDSSTVAAAGTHDPDSLIAAVTRAVATLEEAARRYPDDPEVWYEMGEMRTHEAPPFGHDPVRAFAAFQRAIALDPGFTPGYEHSFELAMQVGRPDLARRYARAYAALPRTQTGGEDLRLVETIFDSGGVFAPVVQRRLRSASLNTLALLGDHLAWWPDSDQTAVVVLREMLVEGHDSAGAPSFAADPMLRRQSLATALALRGRLREAVETASPLVPDPVPPFFPLSEDPFLDLVLMGPVPDSVPRAVFTLSLSGSRTWSGDFLAPLPRYLLGLPWWLARRDTAAIARFGRRAAEVARRPASHRAALRGRYFAAAAPAYLALAAGDSARALVLFGKIPDTLCIAGRCYYEKLTLARLLSARGEDRAAAALLDRWSRSAGRWPTSVLAELERGRIAERMGDCERAEASYRFVVDVWRRADPELRGYVEEAKTGLRRLAGNRR